VFRGYLILLSGISLHQQITLHLRDLLFRNFEAALHLHDRQSRVVRIGTLCGFEFLEAG
jgi:hypothetical protein